MALRINTPRDFAVALLTRLGITPTHDAVRAYVGWQQAEGGFKHLNPLNTTQGAAGASTFNSVGVKTYPDWNTALDATVTTLRNGRYGQILAASKRGDAGAIADAIGASPWGTSSSLIHRVIGTTPSQSVGPVPQQPSPTPVQPPSTPAVTAPDSGMQKTALIAQYLGNEHAPDALTSLATGLLAMGVSKQIAVKAVPATGKPGDSPVTAPGSVPDQVRTLIERANQIDAKHFNYEWGGGHNASGSPTHGIGHGSGPGIGYDCSGAVSKVFGINPLVAGQFMSWGKPGRGKNITVYAKSTHVLIEINGRFFGTSGSNPGGGAGWIPRAALPASYLAGFVARHPAGQ